MMLSITGHVFIVLWSFTVSLSVFQRNVEFKDLFFKKMLSKTLIVYESRVVQLVNKITTTPEKRSCPNFMHFVTNRPSN
jgi:hypothetical protein